MLLDFLCDCQCALENEESDYQEILSAFSNKTVRVGLMPAIIDDLYPVYALSCTSARKIISPNVYMIPVGAHNYWSKPYFEEIVDRFYKNDEFWDQYDIELEEMLLLYNPKLNRSFSLYDGTEYNVIFCRIMMPDRSVKYLFFVPETPDDCWKKIIEPYDIKCDIVIDSHKGMGDWFDSDHPLYKVILETSATKLLPRYYFRGLYISQDVPSGFNLRYAIPNPISNHGRSIGRKKIYEIDWREAKNGAQRMD